ncbi:metalloregulator ArsR/SmtB family transcription factor [Oxyplasma meridianum]|uniref:Metalloregulator ArsR/SmtB family transcription factor n=1 Tax=Oxyplasma meridianum TaxID=3073602 RepID=A0AAX4NFC8_9ARCH
MHNSTEQLLDHILQAGICSKADLEGSSKLLRTFEDPVKEDEIRNTEKKIKALSDATRLKIFLLILRGEKCVCEIEYLFKIPQSTVSRNLGILENSGLIRKRKKGKWVYYSINDSNFGDFMKRTCGVE